MTTGFATEIDLSKLDKMINKLETNLQRFVDKSKDAQTQVVDAFTKMGTNGVNKFVSQLSGAINQVMEIGKKGSAIKWDSQNLNRYIDQVNQLIKLVQQVGGAGFTLPTANLNKQFASISRLKDDLKVVNELLNKGEKTGADSNGNAIYRQLTAAEQNYFVELKKNIQEQLKFQQQSIQERLASVKKALQEELKETQETEKKKTQARNQSYKGAIKYSDKANSLEQERKAIKNLEAARESLKKTDADYSAKLEELNRRINAHRINVEAATKTEAQRNALTSSTRAEYSRLLAEQDKLRQSYDKLKQSQATLGSTPESTAALQNIVKRYRDVYAEIQRYKQSANGQLDATERKFLADQASAFAENERRKTEIAQQEANKRATITSAEARKVITSASGARNINQQIAAIQQLKDARDKLDKTDKDYKKTLESLNNEIKRHQKEIDIARGKTDDASKSHRRLMDTAGQLQRKLALLFSVSAIQGYINKLVEVRGEFELQHKALGAIIQNTDEANRLWAKTVELAVKSPFRIKELVTYTKQLAAYRVETEKLHDTTKMLADVSSGLGVDMNRLILAYGQVKAANYLRGTELRQFSEAGINMLGELSKYFTEIENRAVSVADVFDRVSKRGVSFEDVDKVFKRITSESGIFYKMQEKQSETLKGQISNLHDSIDLMLNYIGKSNEGILKGAIQLMRFFVENWESIATVVVPTLEALLAGWGTYKYLLAINSASSIMFFSNMQKHLKATIILLTRGTTSLQAFARMSNITPFGAWGIVIGVITAALTKLCVTIFEHNKAINDINKKYDELIDKTYKVSTSFMEASRSGGISEMKSKLLELVEIASNDYNMDIQVDVKGMSTEDIKNKFEELRQQIIDMNSFSALFETAFEKSKQWVVLDDIEKDFKDLGQAYSNISQQMLSSRARVVAMLSQNEEELNQQQKEALNILRDNIKENETELEYVERIGKAYEKILNANQEIRREILKRVELQGSAGKKAEQELRIFNENAKKMGLSVDVWRPLFVDFNDSMEEAEKEYQNFIKSISEDIKSIPEEERTVILQAAIDKMAAEKKWSEFVETTVKGWMNTEFNVNLVIRTKKAEQKLEEWQKTYNDKFGDNIITEDNNESLYGFKKIENAATKQAEVIERLQGEWGELNKTIIAVEKAGENATKKGGMYEGVNKGLLEQRKKEVELQLDAFGADYEKKRKSQGKDWLSEVVKSLKEAHQEYIKLNKTLGESESKQMALDKYAKSFAEAAKNAGLKGISLGQFNFETEEGAIDALEFLKNKLPQSAKQARFKLEEAIGEIRGEVRIRTKAEDDKLLIEKIEEMFSGYEMSIELQKLNIPKDLAKQLFNVDSVDLSSIRNKISSELAKAQATGGQEDRVKELKKQLEKVDEMEDKAMKERLKKYVKYLVQAQGERVKIKMDEIRQLNEIESLNFTESQKAMARMAVQQESKQKMDKLEWEDFKDSGMYVQLFEDLEYASTRALTKMRERLMTLKDQLSGLDADDLRHLYNQIEKLDEQLAKRSPYKTAITGINEYIQALKDSKRIELELDKETTITRGLKRDESSLSTQLAIEQSKYRQMVANFNVSSKEVSEQYKKVQTLESQLALVKAQLLAQRKLTKELEKQLDEAKHTRKTFEGSLSDIGSDITEAANALPNIASDLENVFGTMSDGTKDTIDSISTIAGGVGDAISGFASGNYIQAIAGVAKAIGGIFAIGDKKKERQIQREIKLVEDLEYAYNKLENAIDNAYSINTLKASGQAAKKNIESQIDSYNRMIAAEEDKKKADKERIKEWQQSIEELIEKKAELDKELISTVTGGIMDDVLSASKDFTDAWLDAFKETGDGLSGLESNFKETMLEMVKQQAAMLISQSYIDKWKKQLELYINPSDLELSTDEARKWVNAVSTSLPQLNDALEKYFTAMQQAGVDISGSGELSGLQRGIQGVTEETAQIIEAYLNSIRFFVAEQNTYLSQIAATFGNTEVENPMVEQLRIIAAQTSAINSLLQGLVRGGHSLGGTGLKVFIS